MAEFEREIIRVRTVAGLESAWTRGRHGGRPRALDEGKVKLARRLTNEGDHLVEEICSILVVWGAPPCRSIAVRIHANRERKCRV